MSVPLSTLKNGVSRSPIIKFNGSYPNFDQKNQNFQWSKWRQGQWLHFTRQIVTYERTQFQYLQFLKRNGTRLPYLCSSGFSGKRYLGVHLAYTHLKKTILILIVTLGFQYNCSKYEIDIMNNLSQGVNRESQQPRCKHGPIVNSRSNSTAFNRKFNVSS